MSACRARRRERGAIHLIAAAALMAAVLASALAVDVGRLSWQRRDLQRVADLAALDAMRTFGECAAPDGDPAAAARASALRNGREGDVGTEPERVRVGRVSVLDSLRVFTPTAGLDGAHAVRIDARRVVPTGLLAGGFVEGDATLRALAVARQRAVAGLAVGSFAASIQEDDVDLLNQVVGGMLGGALSLNAVSYRGLADASVSMQDLIDAHPSAGTVEELLASELSFSEYATLTASAVDGAGAPLASAALDDLAQQVDGGGRSLTLGDLLHVTPGSEEDAPGATLRALDLLLLGAQVANGTSAVQIDPLGISLPGVASASLEFRIVEAPRIAIGPPGRGEDGAWQTQARTAQSRLIVHLESVNALTLLGGEPVAVDIFFELAASSAHLEAIECARAADPIPRVRVGVEPGLARHGIGRWDDVESAADPEPTPLLSVSLPLLGNLSVAASSEAAVQDAPETLEFEGPFPPAILAPSEAHTKRVGMSGEEAVLQALDQSQGALTLSIEGPLPLGLSGNALLSAVADIVTPLLGASQELVTPLLPILGGHVGGADVTVFTLRADEPELVR